MPPVRKKSRLSNQGQTEAVPAPQHHPQPVSALPPDLHSATHTNVQQGSRPIDNTEPRIEAADKQPPLPISHRSNWYSASSWQSKASPIAQVACESILVDKGVSSTSSDQKALKRRPGPSVSKSFKGGNRKSVPLLAEPTRVHVTSDVSQPPKLERKIAATPPQEKVDPTHEQKEDKTEVEEPSLLSDTDMGDGDSKTETEAETANVIVPPASGSWFGWWSRPDGYGSDTDKIRNAAKVKLGGVAESVDAPDVGENDDASCSELPLASTLPPHAQPIAQEDVGPPPPPPPHPEMSTINATAGRSWFRLWSSTQNEQAVEEDRKRRQSEQNPDPIQAALLQPEETVEAPNLADTTNPTISSAQLEGPKPSGWAFWSKDKPKDPKQKNETAAKEVGELAVADTPSQSHPEAAQFNQEREHQTATQRDIKRKSFLLRPGRGRMENLKDQSDPSTAVPTPSTSRLHTPAPSPCQTPSETSESSPAPIQRGKKVQVRPNLVLPSFRNTYPTAANTGAVQWLTRYIAQSLHIPGFEPTNSSLHPFVNHAPPKVKKAVAIGVHGYFPAQILQRVIGQPTGTSIRFANYAAASIKQWCREHQPDVKDVEVEKVALEGEGFIADRVATLWKLLLNWLSHLRQADFILVACHSQGVPVATTLVAKLLQLGCLSTHVRIGICAMAGVNLGPFPEYRSRFFGGTALELFDFSDMKSKVSIAYAESMEICLRHGVRVTFIGSIDDQLVSLESSLYMPLSHPYVSRTVFIDGRLHTSNFLTHLVVFALKLRNLGVSDHGLIRELSGPLAGSLVGGDGHSRVYDDPAVYQNAVEFALESTDLSPTPVVPPSPATIPDRRKSTETVTQRRAVFAAYPSDMTAANHIRRGSLSALSWSPPGICPVVAPFEAPGAAGSAEKNPFVLPWAVRGMLAEDLVKHDAQLQIEVKELVQEFEAWGPTSKVLKDVRWRLEGVRSMV